MQYYTEGEFLFPRKYNCRILGAFDKDKAPAFQGDAFFYYPLSDISEMQGLLFTNIDNGETLSELTDIIEKSGRSIEYQTYNDSGSQLYAV